MFSLHTQLFPHPCSQIVRHRPRSPCTLTFQLHKGAGIARILGHPSHGNFAVALLARRPEPLQELANSLRSQTSGGIFETFPTDTAPENLKKAFADIKDNASFKNLKLKVAVYSVKHSSKKPFMTETYEV